MNANASLPDFKNPYSQPDRVLLQAGRLIVIFAASVPISTKLCVWSRVDVVVMVATAEPCTPSAYTPACVLVATPSMPAEAVARPETVTAPEKVLAPAKVCVPVDTVPRLLAFASGMFRFKVVPDRLNAIEAAGLVMAGV